MTDKKVEHLSMERPLYAISKMVDVTPHLKIFKSWSS